MTAPATRHAVAPCEHLRALRNLALAAAVALPALALAQDVGGATATACKFLNNVQSLLNAVSVVVVTIAIIFSGYQIAFAHKRISDVAPVMIGAILIGAAGQIAKMFLKDDQCGTTSMLPELMHHFASAAQLLARHA